MPCHFSRSFIVLYSILISGLRQRARGVCSFTKYYKALVGSKELTVPLPSPTFAQLLEITSFRVSIIPSTMASLRPPLSLDGYHRSLPPSPYNMDPRDPRGMNAAFDVCRMGMDGLEYFGAIGMGPFANCSHSQGPYPPGYDQEMMMGGN